MIQASVETGDLRCRMIQVVRTMLEIVHVQPIHTVSGCPARMNCCSQAIIWQAASAEPL